MRGIAPWALVVAMAWAAPARAEDPWKVGVSERQRRDAQVLLEQGNALFFEKKYPEALKKYEEAVATWNHPAIRFNIVRCLIRLERLTEAYDNLEKALEYGAAPLEEAVYSEALNYQKLLEKQIGHLDVSCTQAGARVSLDGQTLIASCPGKASQRVKPGTHQIVAVQEGYLTKTIDAKVVGGEHDSVDVKLVPLAGAARITRRWAVWKPWVVFGGGLALVGVGAGLQFISSSNLDSYDRQITASCALHACDPKSEPAKSLLEDRDRALRENRIAIGMIAAGAGATILGGVLLYMNRSYTVYEKAHVEFTPTSGGARVSIGGAW